MHREAALSQQTMPHFWYLIIEGAIGVGKTTLARMLREHFDTDLLLEVFEENPFLSKFYASRAQYAFQTQMFFLLSRYRQQQRVPRMLEQGPLISDYMFAKDWLFAQLNLAGDEWDVYQHLHDALAEQIPIPTLIVYLQADTDVLMGRIAQRDRPYERDMDRSYIDSLRQAYDRFFVEEHSMPVLIIDSNQLNFVTNPEDLGTIAGRIKSVLQEGIVQQKLPQVVAPSGDRLSSEQRNSLPAYQQFHVDLDKAKGFITDLYFNYLCLSEEMGELGSEMAQLWREEAQLRAQGTLSAEARRGALQTRKQAIESELADCMAYLLKMANYADIDLESAYVRKMRVNANRSWRSAE
jgi:deoxyadenosine/deoxycytidine kinase/NTP pyrophosphatase (non-canonical NTP hydrolase)